MSGHNQPPVVVELPGDLADFLIDNCETNMEFGLRVLVMVQEGTMSRETGQKVVDLAEKFKRVRAIIQKAQKT